MFILMERGKCGLRKAAERDKAMSQRPKLCRRIRRRRRLAAIFRKALINWDYRDGQENNRPSVRFCRAPSSVICQAGKLWIQL